MKKLESAVALLQSSSSTWARRASWQWQLQCSSKWSTRSRRKGGTRRSRAARERAGSRAIRAVILNSKCAWAGMW